MEPNETLRFAQGDSLWAFMAV